MKIDFRTNYKKGFNTWFIEPTDFSINYSSIYEKHDFCQEPKSIINFLLVFFHTCKGSSFSKSLIKRVCKDYNCSLTLHGYSNLIKGYTEGYDMDSALYAVPVMFISNSQEDIIKRRETMFKIISHFPKIHTDSVIRDLSKINKFKSKYLLKGLK